MMIECIFKFDGHIETVHVCNLTRLGFLMVHPLFNLREKCETITLQFPATLIQVDNRHLAGLCLLRLTHFKKQIPCPMSVITESDLIMKCPYDRCDKEFNASPLESIYVRRAFIALYHCPQYRLIRSPYIPEVLEI